MRDHETALAKLSSDAVDVTALKGEISTKTNTLQLVVAEKAELQSKASYLEEHCKLILQEKEILLKEGDTLKLTVADLRAKMGDQASNSSQVSLYIIKKKSFLEN